MAVQVLKLKGFGYDIVTFACLILSRCSYVHVLKAIGTKLIFGKNKRKVGGLYFSSKNVYIFTTHIFFFFRKEREEGILFRQRVKLQNLILNLSNLTKFSMQQIDVFLVKSQVPTKIKICTKALQEAERQSFGL